MQAVADPSLAALAESMAGKKSESISTTAKSDAMPSHGSAASSCRAYRRDSRQEVQEVGGRDGGEEEEENEEARASKLCSR